MRKFVILSTLVVFLVSCNTVSSTRRYTNDPRSFLVYAAFNKDLKTIVIGNPTTRNKSNLEQIITTNLNDNYRHLSANFTTRDTAKMQKPYKIIFVFNPPIQTLSDDVCTAPHKIAMTPASRRIYIMAVFCEDGPISEISANIDYVGAAKEMVLDDALKQMAARLIPEEESYRTFSDE